MYIPIVSRSEVSKLQPVFGSKALLGRKQHPLIYILSVAAFALPMTEL